MDSRQDPNQTESLTPAVTAAAKTVAAPLSQVPHVILRNIQKAIADPDPKLSRCVTTVQMAKELAASNRPEQKWTIKPFFSGLKLSMFKEGARNLYKGALIDASPRLMDRGLRNATILADTTTATQYRIVQLTCAALFAASVDVILGNPLEFITTRIITNQGKDKNANVLASIRQEFKALPNFGSKLAFLYTGGAASLLKGSVQFGVYFPIKQPCHQWVSKQLGMEHVKDENKPWYVKLTSSIATGTCVAIPTAPLDIIKTGKQIKNKNNLSIFDALKRNVELHGYKAFTTGLPLKFFMIGWGWTWNDIAMTTLKMWQQQDQKEEVHETKRLKR